MTARIGSLFSGYGGLDMGVMSVLDADVAWHVEWDKAPSKILDHHWPDVPNYGDVTAVNWSRVEPVDILTGGFPCQDVSLAGRRAGMAEGTRSGLWSEFARAIDVLRPQLVVIENVRGLLSATANSDMEPCAWCVGEESGEPTLRALGAVLGDLADLGYDASWCGLRAADVGAPHGRFRVFVVADSGGFRRQRAGGTWRRGAGLAHHHQPSTHTDCVGWNGRAEKPRRGIVRTATAGNQTVAADTEGKRRDDGHAVNVRSDGRKVNVPEHSGNAPSGAFGTSTDWGNYAPAIRRWEATTSRIAPSPTVPDGRDGNHRLSARFVEWMMGLNAGHVTDAGLTRNEQLKALGNGVVPLQAAAAVRYLLGARA